MSRLLPLLLLLCACETDVTPQPKVFHILEIMPPKQVSNEDKTVTVRLNVEPRFLVDYGEQQVRMLDEPVLEIRSQTEPLEQRTVPLDTYLGHGQFRGRVDAGLPAGLYDLRVKLGDGRETSLAGGYEVRPAVGFWVEEIARQQFVNEPITITLHAGGEDAELFEGTVEVSLYANGATPTSTFVSGPFTAGVRQEQLTIDTPGERYLIVVQDKQQNNRATSNDFNVHSRN